VQAVTFAGGQVYAGGSFQTVATQSRARVACLTEEPSVTAVAATLPLDFAMDLPRPNPTHGTTRLVFSLPRAAKVRMSVYDIQGRAVARLLDGPQTAGRHAIEWDFRRAPRSAGFYVVRMEALGHVVTRTVIAY
jgi:hypothetical protein